MQSIASAFGVAADVEGADDPLEFSGSVAQGFDSEPGWPALALFAAQGGNLPVARVGGSEVALPPQLVAEIGDYASLGNGRIVFPVLSEQESLASLINMKPVGEVDRQLLSSFTASSADTLPSGVLLDEKSPPSNARLGRNTDVRVAYGDRTNSVYRVYDVPTEGAAAFSGNLIPSSGILGPLDQGFQPEFVPGPERTTFGFHSLFSEVTSPPPTTNCPQPFTDSGEVTLNGWRNDELVFTEALYQVSGTFGFGCGFPTFTGAGTGDATAFHVANHEGALRLATKRLTKLNEPSTLLDLGTLPGLETPAAHADLESGAFTFGSPSTGLYGYSDDAARLGQMPWPLDVTPLPLRKDRLFPYELINGATGLRLVGRFDEADLATVGVETAARAGQTQLASVPLDGCTSNNRVVCLNNQQFSVSASYQLRDGTTGDGRARPLSGDSGTFWFFDVDNRELIVKVLDGCGVNGHYWFFAAGLTDVGVTISAGHVRNGTGKTYSQPVGSPFEPILDTSFFECSRLDGARPELEGRATAKLVGHGEVLLAPEAAAAEKASCGGSADALCLANNRYRVEVDFTDFSGNTGSAFGGNLTDDTGALFFFDAANVEMLVKVLDACAINNRFWLFSGALTNVGVQMTVTDTVTGTERTYSNDLGTPFSAITDTQSFACN
ncbi:MAG: hypothetical protein AAGA81_14160 [Acidobacteriota bacterium]